MSRSRLTTIDDLSALSDAQLGEFMGKHRSSNGSFELPVDGWTKLSKEDRSRLAERLQSVQRTLTGNPTPNSYPLDLDKLDTLLRDVSSRDDFSSQDQTRATERQTESPEDPREVYRQSEGEAYDNLVNDGGHPIYPIVLLESVSKGPDAYYELLKPFWRQPRYDTPSEMDHFDARAVFRRQWHRWQNFRKWQLHNRGIDNEDEDDGFLAYVEKVKRNFREVGWAERAAEIEADPNRLKQPGKGWYYIQRHRSWQRQYQRELGCAGFSDYEKALTTRLARHGFTRPLQLAEDPKQQDKLTTWTEYLGFEYWWLDHYTASIESIKPKHDKAWEKLTKLGILEDDETPEFVRTDASAIRRQGDKDRAWKAVQDAELEAKQVYLKTQKNPSRRSISEEERIQMLIKVRARLSSARAAYDLAERRSRHIIKFVRGTFDYDDAKEDVANQISLLQWAVEEAHKIEAEQKFAVLENSTRKMRKVLNEDVCFVQSDPKRQKSNARKYNLQPSNDKIGTGDKRALRRRLRPSTDVNRQLDRDQSHNIHNTYSSQTRVGEQVPVTEAEAEPAASKGSSRKRRKVAFEDDQPILSSPKRLKRSSPSYGSQASNRGAGATDRKPLRVRNRPTTGVSQQPDQYQTQNIEDTNSSSQSPVPNVASHELIQGLRRSSRLAALSSGQGVRSIEHQYHVIGNLGSEYLPVEELLEKRIRRRGRGRITEYLVKFAGHDNFCNLWTAARGRP